MTVSVAHSAYFSCVLLLCISYALYYIRTLAKRLAAEAATSLPVAVPPVKLTALTCSHVDEHM